jgi:hypothetical protein
VQITEERRKRVIDLYFNQHKTYAEIAEIEHISPRDIHAIIKEEEARRQKHKDQQQRQEMSSKAYELFSEKKSPVEVAIILNLPASKVSKLYREYWDLKRLDQLIVIHKETNGKLGPFLKLYKQLIKEKHMSIEKVVNAVDIAANKLPYMESLYKQLKDEVDKLQYIRQGLLNDIAALKYKISILDKTGFSCEQESKRTEQRLQELGDKKDRLEKLIANILNGEDYSKLKRIVKENVKAVLSDNKILISISLVALIQTLKNDPQMVELIQNIPGANDGEQNEDNNNNITKYIESNKDSLLYLTEKNYQNLVEALTNNAIDTAAGTSNPTLLLPSSSSSTVSSPLNQIDIYRIEESEIHHNSQSDNAD